MKLFRQVVSHLMGMGITVHDKDETEKFLKEYGEEGVTEMRDTDDGTTRKDSQGNPVDENGHPFVKTPDGKFIFGEIKAETGLSPAPIKLSQGFNDGNFGYGLAHIESQHGEQIRNAGFESVEEFVQNVARNYTTIRKGSPRGTNKTYLLEVTDGHNNTLFIELSRDGSYWTVNSAGIFRESYSKNKEVVWTLPTVDSSTTADAAGVNRGQLESGTATSENSPQTTSSDKVTESFAVAQAEGATIQMDQNETSIMYLWTLTSGLGGAPMQNRT